MPIHRYFITDLVTIQRQSFFNLLEKGLIDEFSKLNPITSTKRNLDFIFHPDFYVLTRPQYTSQEAIFKNKSYTCKLFVPGQLTDLKTQKAVFKWFYIGNIPLMTKRGHFILNGAPRVIVNQILRSPGIYYQQRIYENYQEKWSQKPDDSYKRFYADLICMRGTWLRIEMDKEKNIWAQMKKGPKIPIYWFLLAMGLSEKKIFKTITDSFLLLGNLKKVSNINKIIDTENFSNKKEKNDIDFKELEKNKTKKYAYLKNPPEAWGEIYKLISINTTKKIKMNDDNEIIKKSNKTNIKKQNSFYLPEKQLKKISSIGGIIDDYNLSDPWGINVLTFNTKGKSWLRNPNFLGLSGFSFVLPEGKGSKEGGVNEMTIKEMGANFTNQSLKNNPYINQSFDSLTFEKDKVSISYNNNTTALVTNKDQKTQKMKLNVVEEGRKWLYNKFMNPRTYNLGKQGRFSFNKKLSLNISLQQTTLTGLDLLYATDHLIKVEKGLFKIDDIDHLKNRRVRTSGDLIQIQIGVGLVRLEKSIRENLKKIDFNKIEPSNITDLNSNKKLSLLEDIFNNQKNEELKIKKQSNFIIQKSKKSPFFSPFQHSQSILLSIAFTQKKGETINWLENTNYSFFSGSGRASGSLPETTLPSGSGSRKNKKETKKGTLFLKNDNVLINFVNSKPFNTAIREFFGTSPLSQFMDQINPLAELTHKRRLSSMGPGGVTRDNATLAIRGIHPTHYGRICPIETPEGKNTGLVNSMTTYARVNENGIIESPFYKVFKGQVQRQTGIYFFSAEQEEQIRLAAADLSISSIGFLPKSFIPVRIGEDFTKITRESVQFVGVSPLQMISVATSLIPFLEHDDANRALMGSNMQRQAVPLIKPERPIVGTGLEARTISDSGHSLIAKTSGFVMYVSSDKIIIYNFIKKYS
jgi:DNA-directed RNA polymerase beta subunit